MRKSIDLRLTPDDAADPERVRRAAAREVGVKTERVSHVEYLRRSIDSRSREPRIQLRVEIFIDEAPPATAIFSVAYPSVVAAPRAIIVGAGPAGLFAALRLIELGMKPIVLERGKDVRARRRDLARLTKEHIVDPDSNYAFGEGGAGTYSDGKLYTRSDKRGNVRAVLERLVAHGASPEILVDAHPHIGTNKLPDIIQSMREAIQNAGGEVHFGIRVQEFLLTSGCIRGVVDDDGVRHEANSVVLATGHSARDIFRMLDRSQVLVEFKPFALGVRVEHSQRLIDRIQYHSADRNEHLPAASYALVEQVAGKGVYSFCMCPGGIIAPCATAQEEIVTNGWSPSRRNNPYANSGIVVSIDEEDVEAYGSHGALRGLEYQAAVERKAWEAGGRRQTAPAQRLVDFVEGRLSNDLPKCSYPPGVISRDLAEVLPQPVLIRLRQAFEGFGRKMRGYYTNEAIVVAVESRTSSPVRIPRDPGSLEHPQVAGLFPCAEGAGYAGGIVSAAMDGLRVAEKLAAKLQK